MDIRTDHRNAGAGVLGHLLTKGYQGVAHDEEDGLYVRAWGEDGKDLTEKQLNAALADWTYAKDKAPA